MSKSVSWSLRLADIVSPDVRSRMMAGIRSQNTKPELLVRCGLHRRGFRFRLHSRNLPGRPDVVLPKYKTVVFVHGCFWHGHDCSGFKWPKTREDFWRSKIESNRARDAEVLQRILALGWDAETVWECDLRSGKEKVESKLDLLAEEIRSRRAFSSV